MRSAKTGAIPEFAADQMPIRQPEMADTSVRRSVLKQRAYESNGAPAIGVTGMVELRDTSRPAELGGTAIMPVDNGSGYYSMLYSDNESTSSSREPALATKLSSHEPATEISSPSASQPEGSPTSISTASLENEPNQKYAFPSACLHNQEPLISGDNPLSAKTPEMFADFDAQSPMQFHSAADVTFQQPWQMDLFASPETPVTTIFKHTSIHTAKQSVPPIVTSWSGPNYGPFPFSRGTESQGLEDFNFNISSTPSSTAVTDLWDSFVNTDVKGCTIYPSDPQNDTGGFVSICDTSPSSQSATSSSNSNTSSETQNAEHEDLKCPECDFRPSGKLKNHKAYLRKHVRTHKNTRVKCRNCEKVYSRQDNATSHEKKTHYRTSVTGAKRRHRSEGRNSGGILQRKKTRSENGQVNLWICPGK
ncbi:hypothetical protein DL764_005649 [Monosporascus ibericus]|uniref:C2H2-type domain-containing protein n=1 Tax=Monosporascus ibericus TaxID=155417 RepID=A0A4V1XAH0_9PEZI|nr:hypothetical protein DL764_005649 [Monosporascus ibericus]